MVPLSRYRYLKWGPTMANQRGCWAGLKILGDKWYRYSLISDLSISAIFDILQFIFLSYFVSPDWQHKSRNACNVINSPLPAWKRVDISTKIWDGGQGGRNQLPLLPRFRHPWKVAITWHNDQKHSSHFNRCCCLTIGF